MSELSINCSCPAGREGGTNTVRFNRNVILQICLMYWGEREVTKVIERTDWATRERQTLKSRACNLLRRYTVGWRREELDVITSYGNNSFLASRYKISILAADYQPSPRALQRTALHGATIIVASS